MRSAKWNLTRLLSGEEHFCSSAAVRKTSSWLAPPLQTLHTKGTKGSDPPRRPDTISLRLFLYLRGGGADRITPTDIPGQTRPPTQTVPLRSPTGSSSTGGRRSSSGGSILKVLLMGGVRGHEMINWITKEKKPLWFKFLIYIFYFYLLLFPLFTINFVFISLHIYFYYYYDLVFFFLYMRVTAGWSWTELFNSLNAIKTKKN